jgi:hypothetical protein
MPVLFKRREGRESNWPIPVGGKTARGSTTRGALECEAFGEPWGAVVLVRRRIPFDRGGEFPR